MTAQLYAECPLCHRKIPVCHGRTLGAHSHTPMLGKLCRASGTSIDKTARDWYVENLPAFDTVSE